MRISLIAILASLSLLMACDEHHHEGAHAHGHAKLSLALEADGTLSGELRAPGADIYGFERQPKDDAERAAKDAADAKLVGIAGWLSAGDACVFDATPPALEGKAAGHDHGHGHDEGDDDGHGEVVFAFDAQCPGLKSGSEIDVNLAALFPTLEKVRVVIVSDSGQRSETLKGGAGKVSL